MLSVYNSVKSCQKHCEGSLRSYGRSEGWLLGCELRMSRIERVAGYCSR